jgi:hypothetical protein
MKREIESLKAKEVQMAEKREIIKKNTREALISLNEGELGAKFI